MGCGCGQRKRVGRIVSKSSTSGAVTASAETSYDVVSPDGSRQNVPTLLDARRLARTTNPRGTIRVK